MHKLTVEQTTPEHYFERNTNTDIDLWRRLVKMIDMSELTCERVEEYINSDLNLERTKQCLPKIVGTDSLRDLNADELTGIVYIDVPEMLKSEAAYWTWDVPAADVPYHEGRTRRLPFLFRDLGSKPVIHYWCVIMKTYLVRGDSGFWIVEDNLK